MAAERPLPSADILSKIPMFTPEAEHKLEEAGCLIYHLRGLSVKYLRDAGKPLRPNKEQNHRKIDSCLSRGTWVAFNPNQLFLPGSNQKKTKEQVKMVAQYSRTIQQKLDTERIKAIIGEAPDYAELAVAHYEASKELLFGPKYDFGFTRTITPNSFKDQWGEHDTVVSIGNFDPELGLKIRYWSPIYADSDIWIAPLIVPA